MIDECIVETVNNEDFENALHAYAAIPSAANEVGSMMGEMLPTLNGEILYACLHERAEIVGFAMSIGSTNALVNQYLTDDDQSIATNWGTDVSEDDESGILKKMHDKIIDPKLAQNYGTNDRMIGCFHISQ